ncbi:MAG: RNA polymerase sigma factor [Phycisphaerae bacterium]
MSAPSDEKLLADYVSGDEGSFELLVRRHARELYQFAIRFTGNSVAAEDVVQEALLQMHTSAEQFDPKRRLKPWLFTITANKARDYLRRRNRKRELPFDACVNQDDESGQRFLSLFSGNDEPPDLGLSLDEKRKAVKDVVESLAPKLRTVLVLSYYHRMPYRDIAEVLGLPLGTVKSRLHAAVAQFAALYEAAAETSAKRDAWSK